MVSKTQVDDKLEDYKGKKLTQSLINSIHTIFLVLRLKFSETDEPKSSHFIYMKKYRSEKKTQDKPVGKTLLVLNIPPYATESAIKRVFSEATGEVERVRLMDSLKNEHKSLYQIHSEFFTNPLPSKFLIGFVIFKKSASLDSVWKLEELPPLSTEEHPILTGVAKYIAEYNKRTVDTEAMQTEINFYMQHYDKVKTAEESKEDGADDDGWVTVGKKGNNPGFQQNEAVISKLETKVQAQKKKNIKNFYSFEFRDGKKQELMDLRRRYEDDKARLNSMKQNRKFRPY